MRIGFIGLGNMGAPMARRLGQAGNIVTGFDLSTAVVPEVDRGSSLPEAVQGAAVVVTMLPNGAAVARVHEDLLRHVAPGTVLIDCSTVAPSDAVANADRARAAGCHALDAPVSGGTAGATAGRLTFMVGGDATVLAQVQPLLDAMGQRVVHCGGPGAGQAAKLCNNMLLGISMIGVCEAFVLAERLGLDWARLYDVAATSSGSCWALTSYCPAPGIGPTSPADDGYRPGFAAELMVKDLALAQNAASSSGAMTPLGQAALALYQAFVADGGRGRDFSAMLPFLAAQNGGHQ
jgi:3-hydroxyisobutyrate dehydrogenase